MKRNMLLAAVVSLALAFTPALSMAGSHNKDDKKGAIVVPGSGGAAGVTQAAQAAEGDIGEGAIIGGAVLLLIGSGLAVGIGGDGGPGPIAVTNPFTTVTSTSTGF